MSLGNSVECVGASLLPATHDKMVHGSAHPETLLRVARTVYHRIGGEPLGAVGRLARDKLVEIAGAG